MSATQPASRPAAQPASQPAPTPGGPFDFIVVGAGAAGSVLAHRLTQSGGSRVLLLEADAADGSRWPRAQLYMPGEREDYDEWSGAGAAGWDWGGVEPRFRRAEALLRTSPPRMRHPLCEAFLAATKSLGGNAAYCRTLMKRGARWSVADAYLGPALRRRNLLLQEQARAMRIVFEGWRAVGVEYRQNGTLRIARTEREIILAAGAIESPRLLQLSGVGDTAQLARLGVRVVHSCPGVGKNLVDHCALNLTARVRGAGSLNERSRGARLALEALKYLLARRGALSSPGVHALAVVGTQPDAARPDLALLFTPGSCEPGTGEAERLPGLTCAVLPLQPQSRGHVRLVSRDPFAVPEIQLNRLADPRDVSVLLAGVRFARKLIATAPMAGCVEGETWPGPRLQGDAGLLDFLGTAHSGVFHPVGTCRMGTGGDAVVDAQLRVRGLAGLRVMDASVMPAMPSADPCAATIMIAEKGADLLLKEAI